ncbi:MAG: hypothetical protein WB780_03020 [Candidatus Acidiferrales bacterium]
MKTRILAGLLSTTALTLVLMVQSRIVHAAAVTLSWSYDYSVDPGCTTTLTKNCVTGFEYGTTPDGGVTLNKIGTVANPTPVPTTLTSGISVAFKQGPPYGSVVYYARATGSDGNGSPVYSSAAVATSVQINPGQPQSVTVSSVK